MTLQPASEVTAGRIHQAIDFTATAISKKYGLDVERIRSVLERTEYIGRNSAADLSQREDDGLHAHQFVPSMAEAFDYLQPDTALALFEKEDPELLKNRVTAFGYLFGGLAPL